MVTIGVRIKCYVSTLLLLLVHSFFITFLFFTFSILIYYLYILVLLDYWSIIVYEYLVNWRLHSGADY